MSDNKIEVFAPFRCVAAFDDGSRLTFDGLTREQAQFAMDMATKQHGYLTWWGWVTDENYRGGEYYKHIPPPPILPFPILDLTDCKTEDDLPTAPDGQVLFFPD